MRPFNGNVALTHHARDKMRARKVSFDDVVDAIRNPDITEPHKGKTRFVKGDLVVVCDTRENKYVVVTILLREQNTWTDHDIIQRRTKR